MTRRSRACALLAVATATMVVLATTNTRAQGADTGDRWSPDEWKAALSEPTYGGVTSSLHYVTAEDGATLSLTLHLPLGLESGTKIPALLQLTPYQASSRASTPLGTGRPFAAYEWFVLRGIAYVEADVRGSAGSEGCLDFGGTLDRKDAKSFADWIRAQRWSNGVIASDGVSHPGMGSVVAHASIDGLAGALAHAPVVSYYQDEWLQGAKFEDQINIVYQAIESAPPLYVDPQALKGQAALCTGQTLLDFGAYEGRFSDLWRDRDLSRYTPSSRIPILLTHGFVDQNVHPDHSQLYWDALPDDYPKAMIAGYWLHGWPDMRGHPFASSEEPSFTDVRHRWLDHLLLGRDNGLEREPRVLIEDNTGVWHESHDWPLDVSERVTFYPSVDETMSSEPGPVGTTSYRDTPGARRGTWSGASVLFKTAPLEAAKLVNGVPEVELVASSDQASTKWVAYLFAEAPDGSKTHISHGYADSHTWDGADKWKDLVPGQQYRWNLKLLPAAAVVEPGERIVLVIASQDSRNLRSGCLNTRSHSCYSPSGIAPALTVGLATNTISLGTNATKVELDWVDPAITQKPPWQIASEPR